LAQCFAHEDQKAKAVEQLLIIVKSKSASEFLVQAASAEVERYSYPPLTGRLKERFDTAVQLLEDEAATERTFLLYLDPILARTRAFSRLLSARQILEQVGREAPRYPPRRIQLGSANEQLSIAADETCVAILQQFLLDKEHVDYDRVFGLKDDIKTFWGWEKAKKKVVWVPYTDGPEQRNEADRLITGEWREKLADLTPQEQEQNMHHYLGLKKELKELTKRWSARDAAAHLYNNDQMYRNFADDALEARAIAMKEYNAYLKWFETLGIPDTEVVRGLRARLRRLGSVKDQSSPNG
jgi:hypothetical protein